MSMTDRTSRLKDAQQFFARKHDFTTTPGPWNLPRDAPKRRIVSSLAAAECVVKEANALVNCVIRNMVSVQTIIAAIVRLASASRSAN